MLEMCCELQAQFKSERFGQERSADPSDSENRNRFYLPEVDTCQGARTEN